jgi:heme/copper-type cytochrome/quinol oxidase subunit 3
MANTVNASNVSIEDVPNGRIAMWWVIASEVVIFGGLVATYLLYRSREVPAWADAVQTSTPLGAINTFVLLTSSLTAVLAHQAAAHKELEKAFKLLWVTVGFGSVFLVVKSIEYSMKFSHGITFSKNIFWSYYFLMTGLHALHVIAGMISMIVISFGVKKGQNLHRVEMAGLYWHFVDIVWIFLFPLLYIAK